MKKEILILSGNGIDTAKALGNFLNDEELYVMSVRSFLEDHYFSRLKSFMRIQSRKSSMEVAEFLENFSGRLGFEKLQALLKETLILLRDEKMKKAYESYKAVEEERERLAKIFFEKTEPPYLHHK